MGRIGVMMSVDRAQGRMSQHFGKAKWFMVSDTENAIAEFVRNEGLNGRSVAEIAVRQGCTDVIVVDIGDGALEHLQSAHIRAWAAPGLVTGQEALQLFAHGQLSLVPAARAPERRGRRHGNGVGRSCGDKAAGSRSADRSPASKPSRLTAGDPLLLKGRLK